MISRASFVALQHRNYRLLWIGLFVSFSGSMMQNAGLLWHVSLLVPPERKGLALGMVGLVRVFPIVIFSMISGVVADAWNRRNNAPEQACGKGMQKRMGQGFPPHRPLDKPHQVIPETEQAAKIPGQQEAKKPNRESIKHRPKP